MKRFISMFIAVMLLSGIGVFATADGRALLESSGMVLLDNASVYAEITDITSKPDGGIQIEVFLENLTDEYLEVYSDYILINRCVIDRYFWAGLSGRTKAIQYIFIDQDIMSKNELTYPDEIKIGIQASKGGGEYYEPVLKQEVCIYPHGLTAADIVRPELPYDWAQLKYADQNYSIEVRDARFMDETGGYTIDLLLRNISEADLTLTINGAYLDGKYVDAFGYYLLPYGTQNMTNLTLWQYMFDDLGINDFDRIEFSVNVFIGLDAYTQEYPAYSTGLAFRPAKG